MGFQRSSERLNGVLLLDALGEDILEGGSDISESSLAVPLCLGIHTYWMQTGLFVGGGGGGV